VPDPLLDRVIRVLRDTGGVPETQPLDAMTQLLEPGLALDSILLLDFVLGLEREFGCELPDEDLTRERFETLGAAAELVRSRVAAAEAQR
jgi:acyl carrier protein